MLKKIKRLLRNLITSLPGQGWWIISIYRKLGLLRRHLLVKYRALTNADWMPNSELVFWIDPMRIAMHTNYMKNGKEKPFKDRVFDPLLDKGKIYAGDWDITDYKFSDLKIYQALSARINNSVDWKETEYYHDMLNSIESGIEAWGCHTQEDLDKRCSYLDSLINSIKEKGYKLNHTIKLESEDDCMYSKDKELSEEVSVNISRNGEYLFQDGRHRLAIAQILGIEQIPVKVLVRHKKWAEFRQFIYSMIEGGRWRKQGRCTVSNRYPS